MSKSDPEPANALYPCKHQFYYIKVDCKGYISHGHVSTIYKVDSTETDIKTSNRTNHNITNTLEQPVINYEGGGGGGLKSV